MSDSPANPYYEPAMACAPQQTMVSVNRPAAPLYADQHSRPVGSNSIGKAGFIISLLGLAACLGLLSPLGLLISVLGLLRRPRKLAAWGTFLGLIGCCVLATFTKAISLDDFNARIGPAMAIVAIVGFAVLIIQSRQKTRANDAARQPAAWSAGVAGSPFQSGGFESPSSAQAFPSESAGSTSEPISGRIPPVIAKPPVIGPVFNAAITDGEMPDWRCRDDSYDAPYGTSLHG